MSIIPCKMMRLTNAELPDLLIALGNWLGDNCDLAVRQVGIFWSKAGQIWTADVFYLG